MTERLLTSLEVADRLSVSPQTVRTLANAGEITHMRLKKHLRFRERDVENFVYSRMIQQKLHDQIIAGA